MTTHHTASIQVIDHMAGEAEEVRQTAAGHMMVSVHIKKESCCCGYVVVPCYKNVCLINKIHFKLLQKVSLFLIFFMLRHENVSPNHWFSLMPLHTKFKDFVRFFLPFMQQLLYPEGLQAELKAFY